MVAGPTRDDGALTAGFEAWLARGDAAAPAVAALRRPSAGWTNETVIMELAGDAGALVVRMPPIVPSFPRYALDEQGAVMRVLEAAGIPVPQVVAVEHDDAWLGAPFLVMSCVAGRALGEVPALDPWLGARDGHQRRAVHESFLRALAAVHLVEPGPQLRGLLRCGVAAELGYWRDYLAWAADGTPTPRVAEALDWCSSTAPAEGDVALLWGDARLGNVMYDDDAHITALLDWELATLGPPEMDLAWYLALDALTTHFVGRVVDGFFERDAAIACYEAALGRAVERLEWHEVFALVRSIAVNECQARLAARAGTRYPGVAGEENPVLDYVWSRIDQVR
jgi:aminoglycoside phosphotransferase (APT) family kinase protein